MTDKDVRRALDRVCHDAENNRDDHVYLITVDALDALVDAIMQSDAEPIRAFAKSILHGDDDHKAWLLEAAEAFIVGKPLPAPRGKGTAQERKDMPDFTQTDMGTAE